MQVAIKWGIVFGILQATITIIVAFQTQSSRLDSFNLAILGCTGFILSGVLSFLSGLIAARESKKFMVGLVAAIIQTAIDTLAGLISYIIAPALLQMGLLANIVAFVFSDGVNILLGAAGAGVGIAIIGSLSSEKVQS